MKPSHDTKIRFTYALVDPRNFEVRYIGITKNIISRLSDHIRIARNNTDTNIHKKSWIKQLLNLNLVPLIVILEECTLKDSQNSEIWWIELCRNLGFNLVNLTNGGDYPNGYWLGKKHSEESKQKQSLGIGEYYKNHNNPFKGKNLSDTHKRNIVKAWKEKGIYRKGWTYFVSEERVEKVYQKRSDNEEWRNNLSFAAKERLGDPAKNPMYGKNNLLKAKKKIELVT